MLTDFIALYDACVLYSASLRDLLMRLALTDLFRARWTDAILQRYRIEAQHPDEFVCRLLDLAPTAVYAAVRRQREGLKNPPRTAAELLETLEDQRLVQTVTRLRMAIDQL